MSDPINHGTYAGCQQHRRQGTPPCDECRAAAAEYQRRYRASTGARDVKRNASARAYTLARFRDLAPDLYRRLYREGALKWDDEHPYPMEQP